MAKKRFGIYATLMVLALVGLVSALEYKRQAVSAQLGKLTVQLEQMQQGGEAQQQKNEETAQRIIAEVRVLIEIPADIEPTVATIVDVETLRARNPFYDNAQNGDHLIVTTERAILYRSSEKKIIDVVPVQLQPAEPPAGDGSAEQ